MYPKQIYSGMQKTPHVQGIAIDDNREYMYFSFTTALVKTDMQGNIVGSVTGLGGHLGCIAFHNGRVYGSLEYKQDAIGKGIRENYFDGELFEEDAFYVASFQADAIIKENMQACEHGEIMTTVYLKEVVDDYIAPGHRYGCSGIDGLTFAPEIGKIDGQQYLYVAYGIYGDVNRSDNDNQVILRYDISDWAAYERPLSQRKPHKSGPSKPTAKYFLYTGNTNWGVQNMEYDPYTKSLLLAVYPGQKAQYPNYAMFMVDMEKSPEYKHIPGLDGEQGACISLKELGVYDEKSQTYGWRFPYADVGIIALGEGYYYVSHQGCSEEGSCSTVKLYQWDGVHPFEEV